MNIIIIIRHAYDCIFIKLLLFETCFQFLILHILIPRHHAFIKAFLHLLILGLISLASFLAIGFTSIRTDKAHMGLYCGAMCTFLFMVILPENGQYKTSRYYILQ